MKPCVLVHGADNFVGGRLAAHVSLQGWARVVEVRGGDEASLARTANEAQVIAHCITGSAAHIQRSAAALHAAVSPLKSIPRIVHLGSMTVYGSAQGVIAETAPLRADLGPYSQAQRDAETLVVQRANAVVLRAGVEYGPACGAWSGRVARWLGAGRLGDLGEHGDGVCNLVYIDDLISILQAALSEPGIEGAIFNVAAPDKITWNDYFTAYAIALGAVPVRRIGRRRLHLETRVAAPVLRLAEIAGRTAGMADDHVPPPIPPSLLGVCRQAIELSTQRLDRQLRPRWTALDQGLRAAAEFYG